MGETIASTIASLGAVPHHAPWRRFEVDAQSWSAIGKALGEGEGELVSLWGDAGAVHMAVRVPPAEPCVISLNLARRAFPSIGAHHAPAIRLERAACDLYGYVAEGAPDRRGWLDHGQWELRAPLGTRTPAPRRDPADYEFLSVHGHGLHQIPVGPVHAGIIEPGHFRFTANGETVARLEERLGYVHKGIDALLTDVDMARAGRIVARASGDSTVALGFAFSRAVEAALGLEVPPRAIVLRGVMAELERIANHFGDIGAICNDAAFVLIHAHCGIFRERVLAACDRAFGHRLMMDTIVPGGVARDIAGDGADAIISALVEIEPRFDEIAALYRDTPSVQDRTCGTGIAAPGLVKTWAAGGHVGRGSGRDFDARRDLAYPPYRGLSFDVPVFTSGDVDARLRVRVAEVRASIGMIKTWLADLPAGPMLAPAAETERSEAAREGVAVTEAFRGDLLVWLRLAPDGRVARCHVRDASWLQWPLLEAAIENNIVADFPLCNKSFNCSYSGHDL